MAAKRRRLSNLTVKEVSLVGVGANQPARVALWKSADVPAKDAAPPPADTKNSTAPLSAEIAAAIASALKAAEQIKEKSMDEKDKAEALAKAAEQADLIKTLTAQVEASKTEAAAKAAETAAVTAERDVAKATLAKAERDALVVKTVGEVKDMFKALPGVVADAFALDLIELREKSADLAKKFETVLKAANDAIAGSDLFKTVGAVVKSGDALTAEQEYEGLIAKTMATDKVARGVAVVKVLDTPEGQAVYGRLVAIGATK